MKRSFIAMLLVLPLSTAASALVVNITYDEGVDEGFDHPALGADRRAAFERALEIWTTQLDGTVELEINAQFNSLPSIDILGAAASESYSANLPGLGNVVWYPAALASQLNGNSRPAIAGPFLGFHMSAEFNSDRDTLAVGAGRWYYGLDGNPPGTDKDFVTVALHELGHAFGFGPLINYSTGAWAFPFPKDFPDIFSTQLTRTPDPSGGPLDKDFDVMTDAERLSAMASDEMYWKGLAAMGAAEFTTPPPVSSPQINSNGEVQMYAPSTIQEGQTIAHWAKDHAQHVVMEQPTVTFVVFADIDATKEAMIDLGWGFQTPPASGAVAWVDFNFGGEAFGTEALPFSTFGEAVSFVTVSGTVYIKPGDSSETLTVNNAMTVNAVGGSATIGSSIARSVLTPGSQESRTGFISRTRTQ